MNLSPVQDFLKARGIDGWLLYDNHGINSIAQGFMDVASAHLTRRWFYYIPAQGTPQLLVHVLEAGIFPERPGECTSFLSWRQLQDELKRILSGAEEVAMEYSPCARLPNVSMVDGGTLELVRGLGVEVVSSADIIQYFRARWTPEQLESHKRAARLINQIKDEAFALIGERLRTESGCTELEIQAFIEQRFGEEKLVTDHPPIVAVNANASNPHYAPSADEFSALREGDSVLIDLWAKGAEPENAVFADITWMGYAGEAVPARLAQVFKIAADARDLAVERLRKATSEGETMAGWMLDDVVRGHIKQAGYADYFIHRTGHSIDTSTHGAGVNLDNLETHDERQVLPGVAFSVEPGIYLEDFGVRTEINIYYSEQGPQIFTPVQDEVIAILA